MFRAIGFDYNGVVAGVSSTEFKKEICTILQIEETTFQNIYFKHNSLINQNILSVEEFWKKITKELGVFHTYTTIISYINTLPRHKVNKKMITLIDNLRKNGYKTGLFTNNNLEVRKHFKETGLDTHFDTIVISSEIGFNKPEKKAFEIFLHRLDVSAHELIFIDDTEKSLSTAKKIGYTPILFTDYNALQKDLDDLGIVIKT
jgi:putative hydrolase of the HAD superfamily